jgi:hypothetical protein
VLPFIEKYCVACHNEKSNSGGLDLRVYRTTKAFKEDRDTWERILKRIAAESMPPRNAPKPSANEVQAVAEWLRNEFARKAKR